MTTIVEENHSASLLGLIAGALDRLSLLPRDMGGIAVSVGPGSFTGLRVGISTAKALAYSAGKPIVGVSSLEALAVTGLMLDPSPEIACPMVDARKGEVFSALFERRGHLPTRLVGDFVAQPVAFLDEIQRRGKECVFLGDGAEVYAGLIRQCMGPKARLLPRRTWAEQGREIARLGREKLLSGTADQLAALSPVYVRPPYAKQLH
jgi:tRNA threonylcarbamoyladenosine biosynthesis protein TsaB